MGKLFLTIKKNTSHIDIFYRGEKLVTISVNEGNRSNYSIINLEASSEVQYKLVKEKVQDAEIADESIFNREEYNK